MFEGLYDKLLKPEGPFREQLKAAGYDAARAQPGYPIEVWVACLDVTWKARFPTLERHEAWRAIGRAFIEGYLDTLVGRLVSVALPFLTPKSFLQKSPRFLGAGVEGASVELEWKSDREVLVTLRGPHAGAAWVTAGVVDVCLARLGTTPTVQPSRLPGADSQLLVSWPPTA